MTTAFSERTEMAAATGGPTWNRHALRHVAGLYAAELADIAEVEYRALRLERVVLIGVWSDGTLSQMRKTRCASSPGSPRPRAPSCLTA